jgi:hypothetical protein
MYVVFQTRVFGLRYLPTTDKSYYVIFLSNLRASGNRLQVYNDLVRSDLANINLCFFLGGGAGVGQK